MYAMQRTEQDIEELHQYNLKVKILSRLVKVAKEVYVYALTSDNEGIYLKIAKKELIEKIESNANAFDENKFRLSYIDYSANDENNWQRQQALYIN